MYLIVGLGNPGLRYENTRHNVGFKTIDILADRYNIKVKKLKCESLIGQGEIFGHKVVLAKPQTFMNNSGIAVKKLSDYFDIEVEDIIVIVDDIDINFPSIRMKKKGSSGSHNGMKSIIYHLYDDNFARIKIAVGKKPEGYDLANFVLSQFNKDEVGLIEEEILAASDCVEMTLKDGIDKAMNCFNSKEF